MTGSSGYKDDPEYFGQSADSVQPDPGLGKPQDKATTNPPVVDSADWKDGVGPLGAESPLRKADGDDPANASRHDDQHPPSRSADPGQSSYGGFKNEGPADDAGGDPARKRS